MIPSTNYLLSLSLEQTRQPSRDYKLDFDSLTITGTTDGLEAVKQAIYKILSTERYEYPIYSWDYGVEFASLIGKSIDYAIPESERRIKEALTQDDRINSCDSFEFLEISTGALFVQFRANTIFGAIQLETEVVL